MTTVIRGNFQPVIHPNMPSDAKIGTVLPKKVMEKVSKDNETRIKLGITNTIGVRPFIDQPIAEGTFPEDIHQRKIVLSNLIHSYRNSNPNVVHAVGILASSNEDDEVAYLTDLYYKCQSAFAAMLKQLKDEKIIPITPAVQSLRWENIAFPRLANNLHLLKAIAMYIEQEENQALIVHILFLYSIGPATVYSTRCIL